MKVALSVKGYTKNAQRTSPDVVDMPRNLHMENTIVRSVRSFGCAQSHAIMLTSPTYRSNTNVSFPRAHHARCSRHQRPLSLSQLLSPPALSMAWQLIHSKHDPHSRQRRDTSFALLPLTTRSSLLSCSRRGSIPINCFRRAASKNFVPKSAVFSNVSTLSTFTCPSTLACCNQRLLT